MKLLFLLLPFLCVAQTYQYTYTFSYKLDTLKQYTHKDNLVLEIDSNNKIVRFFDKQHSEYDSLIVNTGTTLTSSSKINTAVKKQLHTDTYENFFNLMYLETRNSYFTLSTIDKMDWKLEQETKTIDGYEVQKATTSFGGRQWTAWFCKDIPFFEGPYKFHGLPGLIFEVYDSQNYFHFLLQKGQKISWKSNSDRVTEKFYGNKPIKVTQKQLTKIYKDFYSRPIEQGNWELFDYDNDKYFRSTDSNEVLKELIQMRQNDMKRQNNPIDKRFMIDYE